MIDYYCGVLEITTGNPNLCEENRKEDRFPQCKKCTSGLVEKPPKPGPMKTKPANDGKPLRKKNNLIVIEKKKKGRKKQKPSIETAKQEAAPKCPGCGVEFLDNPVCICATCGDRFCEDCSKPFLADSKTSKTTAYLCPTCWEEIGTKVKVETESVDMSPIAFPSTLPMAYSMDPEKAEPPMASTTLPAKTLQLRGVEAFIIYRMFQAPDVADLQGEEALMFAQAVGNLVMESHRSGRAATNFTEVEE